MARDGVRPRASRAACGATGSGVRVSLGAQGGSVVERDELSGLGPLGTGCASQTTRGCFSEGESICCHVVRCHAVDIYTLGVLRWEALLEHLCVHSCMQQKPNWVLWYTPAIQALPRLRQVCPGLCAQPWL